MIILKDIVTFDGGYFEFLQDEPISLGKNICEKFKEKVVKNYLVFGLVGVLLKKIVYGLLSVNIMFALDFLLMLMTLVPQLTRNLLLLMKTFAICQFLL